MPRRCRLGELPAGGGGAGPRGRPRRYIADYRAHGQRPSRRRPAGCAAPGAAALLPARQIAPASGGWTCSRREGRSRTARTARPHRAGGAAIGAVTGQTAAFRRTSRRRSPTTCRGARDPRADDVDPHLPLHGLGRAAPQVACHERLTLGASFGVLVLVFEWGRGLSGLSRPSPSCSAATAFALSTTTPSSFLADQGKAASGGSRIATRSRRARAHREARDGGALLFCVAIGTFATSGISFYQELGLGTAVAVVLDATIVRAFLVPSLMAMLGRWNWGRRALRPSPPAHRPRLLALELLPPGRKLRRCDRRVRRPLRPGRIPPGRAASSIAPISAPAARIAAASGAEKRPSPTRVSRSSSS